MGPCRQGAVAYDCQGAAQACLDHRQAAGVDRRYLQQIVTLWIEYGTVGEELHCGSRVLHCGYAYANVGPACGTVGE